MTGTQQAIAAALRSAAEEVRMSPEQVEQRYVELRERQESVDAGPGGRRRRVVVAAAALGAAAAVAVGVALAGWPGGDAAPAPAVTQDTVDGDAEAVELWGGERVEPGGRYLVAHIERPFTFTAPEGGGTGWGYTTEQDLLAGLFDDTMWVGIIAPREVYAPTGTWIGQRSLVPAPADPEAYFAYLVELGAQVGPTEPAEVGGRPALVADVRPPATVPADRAGCSPERAPCIAIAPRRPQTTGLAGTEQLAVWHDEVARHWALEVDDRLVILYGAGLDQSADEARRAGEEFAASIAWR